MTRHSFSFVLASLLIGACTASGRPDAANPGQASFPAHPVDTEIRAVTVVGGLSARTAQGAWQPLAEGQKIRGVTELRATGKGAIMALGSGGDTVWLRGGAHVRLSGASGSGVLVDVAQGQARVRSAALPVHAWMDARRVDVTGRDALLRKSGQAAATLAFTETAPAQATWSVALESGEVEAGIGTIVLPEDARTMQAIELRRVAVNVSRAGDYAFTEVEHVFYNPNDQQLEGTFYFPLPDGAMPLGLAMEINGRLMEGEMVERQKARETYEAIVDSMRDPALLEWQDGNRFKLRVFPIEPQQEKRVVLRYGAPLAETIDGWEYVYATAAPDMQRQIPRFSLRFDERAVVDREGFVPGEDVVVPLADADVPRVVRQELVEGPGVEPDMLGIYTAVHIEPDWSRIPAPAVQDGGRSLLVILDSSRSALEGQALALQTVEMLLAELGTGDRFLVLVSDIEVRPHQDGFVAASPEAATAALDFARAITPDGASDLDLAFTRASELAAPERKAGRSVEVVYVGDGTPTWGATSPDELGASIARSLDDVPVHAALIGKTASTAQWQRIAGKNAGRVARPRTELDARRFAFLATRSATTPRIEELQIEIAGAGTTVLPAGSRTLYRGDSLIAVMRTEPGQPAPTSVALTGRHGQKPVSQALPIAAPRDARLVAQRWAALRIAELEADGGDRDEIVKTSTHYGVMSKHTSLLVLESEEAYAQHGIERRNALAQNALAPNAMAAPQVTGGDLESLSQDASLSPDHIQPGDPEIRIPAPADARSVVVVFPFGDTKIARLDPHDGVWITRFLIDKDTPDGRYEVLVMITHASGHVTTHRLSYVVDTRAPMVRLTVVPEGRNAYRVTAEEIVTQTDLALGGDLATITPDVRRVEVRVPSGHVIMLSRVRPGVFERVWKTRRPITEPATLRVVATDEALNQSAFEVRMHADGRIEPLDTAAATGATGAEVSE
jgi:Vault protein inter-alpha-trypsin domain/von Willebrand factor type A domain